MEAPAALTAGPDGPAVLLLHGIGGDGRSWQPQIEALAEAGYRAIAWHMPGYAGSSSLPAMTFPALAEAALRLLDAQGVARAVVVGHSIGGMVAQELAATAPERLDALVLSATTAAFGSRDGSFQREFLAKRLKPLDEGRSMAEIADAVVPQLVGDGADPAGIALARARMAAVPADAFRAALHCLVTFDRRAALPAIRLPTLLIAGEGDTNSPARTMSRMAGEIAGARLVVLEGAGHLANLEQPGPYNGALLSFLAGLRESA